MIKKTIKFQEQIKIWQQCEAVVECPDDETHEQTLDRIRREGVDVTGDYSSTNVIYETEERIPDADLNCPRTIDEFHVTGVDPQIKPEKDFIDHLLD